MLIVEVGTFEVLKELSNRSTLRFKDLRKLCKIPQNTLVRRLKQLENNSLIKREVSLDRSVNYKITNKGKECYNLLLKLNKLLKN